MTNSPDQSSAESCDALAGKVERIARMMHKLLADLPFCDPDIKDLEQAATALRTFPDAQPEQEPAGYQFRQRSGVGKGPQSSAPWCDWCAIDRETYEKYCREPNKLVQVRPVYAAQPPAAPVEPRNTPFMMLSCREAKQCLHQIPGCICDGDPTLE